jgi:polyferredoxin
VWTVIGPSLLSGYRSIVAFGALNLIGLGVVAVVYAEAFASLWCVWAALSSILVTVHMFRRRHLPDSDRLEGHPRARDLAGLRS